MRFPTPLMRGRLVRRYKRFLADVELDTGEVVTAHCANPGSMMGLVEAGTCVWLSHSPSPHRKLAYSWELLEVDLGCGPAFVGINTGHPNGIVAEALAEGMIEELAGYETIRREVPYGTRSRVDFLLEGGGGPPCYVEVKNVHLMRQPGLAEFPDSVTARGARHLEELAAMAENGARAVMLFLVQRTDADRLALAADIDPVYAATFAQARRRGVETLVYCCKIDPEGIHLSHPLPMVEAAPEPVRARFGLVDVMERQ